jgi:hypothetical protein
MDAEEILAVLAQSLSAAETEYGFLIRVHSLHRA